jgi:hypothetical protein
VAVTNDIEQICAPIDVHCSFFLSVSYTHTHTKVKVTESGRVVWDGDKFITGATGVKSVTFATDGLGVVVELGPGSYNLASTAAAPLVVALPHESPGAS